MACLRGGGAGGLVQILLIHNDFLCKCILLISSVRLFVTVNVGDNSDDCRSKTTMPQLCQII